MLYDGLCGLCHRLNQFILRRDTRDQFRFAALQSTLAGDLLHRYGHDASRLDTVYVVANYGQPDERLYARAHAVLFVLRTLGGIWGLARVVALLPAWLLNPLYDRVAAHRYRLFGRSDSCLVPEPRYRTKFLDTGGTGA